MRVAQRTTKPHKRPITKFNSKMMRLPLKIQPMNVFITFLLHVNLLGPKIACTHKYLQNFDQKPI